MALRMLLTAMVVSLSLPLPSMDSCRLLVNEMNQELATVLHEVHDQWSPRNLKLVEVTISEDLAKIDEPIPSQSRITDVSFSRILEEFAQEAMRPEIEEAAEHARKIPLELVDEPLPPAAQAIDELPSALDLIRSISAEREASAVVSDSKLWNDIVSEVSSRAQEIDQVIDMVHPVISNDIGPWRSLVDEGTAETQDITPFQVNTDVSSVSVIAVESSSEAWDREIQQIGVADDIPVIAFQSEPENLRTNHERTKAPTFQDAFRKTAEAIALWSKVMTKAY